MECLPFTPVFPVLVHCSLLCWPLPWHWKKLPRCWTLRGVGIDSFKLRWSPLGWEEGRWHLLLGSATKAGGKKECGTLNCRLTPTSSALTTGRWQVNKYPSHTDLQSFDISVSGVPVLSVKINCALLLTQVSTAASLTHSQKFLSSNLLK